ncbi:MAG: DUF4252 domain-containing protein [Bacteroidales bacterium]|nr:DUF4252 domain-containing protein [Bacteroidales bacterium]
MKKAIIMLAVLLVPVMTFAVDPGGKISKRKVSSFVSQYRNKQGVDVFELGSLGTAFVKSIFSVSSVNDKDAREALTMLKGLKGLTIISYEDAEPGLKKTIDGKLQKMLKGVDLLMEAKDEGETVRFYGTYNDKTGKVSDVGIFAPTDGTFIFLVGSFNLDDISKAMAK